MMEKLCTIHCNGYLKKVSGGRDKLWALTSEARETEKQLRASVLEVRNY